MMLHNRFAGDALKKVDRFYEAGIEMNGQIVLCKGVNDGAELERSISDMSKYLPHLRSVSVVPVGLSKYREGLYPLEPFTKEEAQQVLATIHKWQEKLFPEYGTAFYPCQRRMVYPGRKRRFRTRIHYDGYLQLENGVGMIRLLLEEFEDSLRQLRKSGAMERWNHRKREISTVTGRIVAPYIERMARRIGGRISGALRSCASDPQRLFWGTDYGNRAFNRTGYHGAVKGRASGRRTAVADQRPSKRRKGAVGRLYG